jgi:NADH-quinone oxidoreductase subunit N
MSAIQWLPMAPLLVLSGGALLLMMQVSIRRGVTGAWITCMATTLAAALSCIPASQGPPTSITPLLMADGYALFFAALFSACGFITAVVSRDYLSSRPGQNEEFFLLLLLSTLGAAVLAYANHFASLVLGMELLGVSLYALIGYPDRQVLPLEAAIKYLVLSAAASATFLFGFALLYAGLGVLDYAAIGSVIRAGNTGDSFILLAAGAMIVAGLGFKLSLVPFHMWTPDVYEGAPAPITGFMAAVSKGAIFAALLRWWTASALHELPGLLWVVTLLAGASMLIGNLLALRQDNVKRVLAYSSIAHMGYLMIVLVAGGLGADPTLSVEAAGYYLVAYTATSLAAFTLLGLLSGASGQRELADLKDLTGLFWRQPGLALLFTVALLSLAGIPLTAGFIGKFYLFSAGVAESLWGLLALLVVGSGMGLYYYLRMVFRMTLPATSEANEAQVEISWPARLACAGLVLAMLYFGVIPEPLIGLLRTIIL